MSETPTKKPLAANLGRMLAMRSAIGIVAAVVGGCLGCVMVSGLALLANNADPGNPTPVYLATCCVVGLFISGVFAVTLFVVLRQNQGIDERFLPLGLEGRPYAVRWRQYSGIVGGRETKIRFSRGPTVSVTLQANTRARVTIGTRTALGQTLSKAFDIEEVTLDDSEFARLVVRAGDTEWLRTLLSDAAARAATLRLMEDASAYDIRVLYIEAERMRLYLRRIPMKYVTTEAARQWLDDMVVVASVAEKLPPSVSSVEPQDGS